MTTTLVDEKVDAERTVLGELTLATPEKIDQVLNLGLRGTTFLNYTHRAVFDAILSLHRSNKPADVVTISHAMGDDLKTHGGEKVLIELLESAVNCAHIEHHVGVLLELNWKHSTAENLTNVLRRLQEPSSPVDEIRASLREIFDATEHEDDIRPAFATSGVPFDEFCASIEKPEYLINRVLSRGEEMVFGAPEKSLKTSTMADMAISLATATPFLDYSAFSVTEPRRVCFMTLETGKPALQSLCRRVARAKQLNIEDVGDSVVINQELPIIANEWHMRELVKYIDGEAFDVAMVDPAYLALFDENSKVQAGNLLQMGPLLRRLTEIRKQTGVTFVLAHHTRKAQNKLDSFSFHKTTRDDLSQSGFAQWMRQWALLSRKSAYSHDGIHTLQIELGGSSGHGGEYVMEVNEGKRDDGDNQILTDWQTTVTLARDYDDAARAEKEQQSEAKQDATLEKYVEKVRAAMKSEGIGKELSKNAITQNTSLNDANTGKALYELRRRGEVVMDDSNPKRVKWSIKGEPDKPDK